MQIVDLTEDRVALCSVCLEDWSEEAQEGGPRRQAWLKQRDARGLRVKIALDDQGVEGGMIQYSPIEQVYVDGARLYFIHCIFVHGYKQGRGDFRKRGMGKALLAAAEEDARRLGAQGMAAWGLWMPFWMRAGWFKRHGYRKVDRQGMAVLLWKPFTSEATPPRWFPKGRTCPECVPGKVNVDAFCSGWCLGQNLTFERAKRAAATFGDNVVFREFDTSSKGAAVAWGVTDGVFVDGRSLQQGAPPSYARIHKAIAKRVACLKPGP